MTIPESLFLAIKKKRHSLSTSEFKTSLNFALILDGSAQVDLIDFRYMRGIRKRQRVHSNAFRP